MWYDVVFYQGCFYKQSLIKKKEKKRKCTILVSDVDSGEAIHVGDTNLCAFLSILL